MTSGLPTMTPPDDSPLSPGLYKSIKVSVTLLRLLLPRSFLYREGQRTEEGIEDGHWEYWFTFVCGRSFHTTTISDVSSRCVLSLVFPLFIFFLTLLRSKTRLYNLGILSSGVGLAFILRLFWLLVVKKKLVSPLTLVSLLTTDFVTSLSVYLYLLVLNGFVLGYSSLPILFMTTINDSFGFDIDCLTTSELCPFRLSIFDVSSGHSPSVRM